MNKQGVHGIEWTEYTWNPVGGCRHACRWTMPDGSEAKCYAETVAEGLARAAYPSGFQAHYWRPETQPEKLLEPLNVKRPSLIFLDSMSDLMGAWVPDDQIEAVLDMVRQAHWHRFQLLTKNAPRLLKFDLPANLWVGVSMPPTSMLGHVLDEHQKVSYMHKALAVLRQVDGVRVRWLSLEPLSFDIGFLLEGYDDIVNWLVIGAATNGARAYQPDPLHVRRVLSWADRYDVPVFFKGNLQWSPWRNHFPKQVR